MDTRSIMAPLNAAAASLATIARSIGAKGAELRDSFHTDQVRKQLLNAAEELRDAAAEATKSARKAAVPYAQEMAASAQQQIATLRDGVASGAQALAKQMKKPNVVSRHPYATAVVVAGACFVAVREWRRRRAASQPAKPRVSAAARKTANGAARTSARKRPATRAAAASKSASAVH